MKMQFNNFFLYFSKILIDLFFRTKIQFQFALLSQNGTFLILDKYNKMIHYFTNKHPLNFT